MTFGIGKRYAAAATSSLLAAAALIAPAASAHAAVPTIDAAGLKKQVAARKGKVVVVNFWATWCGPCVEEFPSLVKLKQQHASKGLDLITVAFDEATDDGKVSTFLTKNKAGSGVFRNKSGSEPGSAYFKYLEPKLGPNDAVALPRTYIFDKSGKLVKVITGGQSYAAFQAAVAPYLK